MRHPLRILAALAVVTIMPLSACTAATGAAGAAETSTPSASAVPLSEIAPVADPKSITGPSTATLADDDVAMLVDPGIAELPVTVTSHDLTGDTRQTVTDTSRVLALDISGALSATVWGLGEGAKLVGRDVSSTFDQVKKLPVVTQDGHSINSEAVLRLKPTLVITDGTIGPTDVVSQLRSAGVTVVYVKNDASLAGAADLAVEVADALGIAAAGAEMKSIVAKRIAATEAEIDRIRPAATTDRLRIAFLYLRGSSGIYYLLGEGTGADALATSLGGIDVAKEIGWAGARPMTDEALVKADADLYLVMTDGLASVGGVDELLKDKPAVALTTAGEHRRFVDMADGQILSFGPRTPDVLAALARAIYAP